MSDAYALILVLGFVYLSECLRWVRRDAVVFVRPFGLPWKILHPSELLGDHRRGWILLPPLPPLGPMAICQRWPISVSKEGICAFSAQHFGPGERPPRTSGYLPFDSFRNVEVSARTVVVSGRSLVDGATEAAAEGLGSLLGEIAASPLDRREAAIDTALARAADRRRIEARLDLLRSRAAPLAWLGNFLFLYLFVLSPVVLRFRGLPASWKPLLLGLAVGWLLTVIEFLRAHRVLFPSRIAERWKHVAMMSLAPTGAIRALDHLGRDLFAGFEPTAVASVLLPKEAFRRLARRVLRDLRHPIEPPCPTADEAARRTEAWFRERLLRSVEGVVRDAGDAPEDLVRPPRSVEPRCRAYCPRCEAQFEKEGGKCDDCGGIPLAPL